MPSRTPSLDVTKEVVAASKALAPAVKRIGKALQNLDPSAIPNGSLADFLYDLKDLQKQLNVLIAPFADVLPSTTKAVEEHFIATLAVGESTGVQGHKARVQVTESIIPQVLGDGWAKFYAHIKKTGEFELLNRAINRLAIMERLDAKKQVPGVTKFHAKKVSCTKLSSR